MSNLPKLPRGGSNPFAALEAEEQAIASAPTAVAKPVTSIADRIARATESYNPSAAPELRREVVAKVIESTGLETLEVAVHDLLPNPFNPRIFYDENVIAQRAVSLKTDGQKVPILVAPVDHLPAWARTAGMRDGQWVIIDGEYRTRGARLAHIPTLLAIVDRNVRTSLEWYRTAAIANQERHNGSIFDEAISLLRLREQVRNEAPDMSDTDFAEQNGMDKSKLSRLLQIAALPESIAEILHAGEIGGKIAYEVALYWKATEDPRKTSQFAQEIVSQGLSLRDVTRQRQKVTGEATKRERMRPVVYEFALNPQAELPAKGSLKTFDDGRLMLEISGLDEDSRVALLEELRRRFVDEPA